MQLSLVLGAGTILAAFSWTLANRSAPAAPIAPATPTAPAAPAAPTAPTKPTPPERPQADGHYVLVVEGDRNGLAITHASRKQAPWAGNRKGLESSWRLIVRDDRSRVLADIPLDVTPFATSARALGQRIRTEGCIVIDSRIGMLVNAPRFATAQSYEFARIEANGATTALGSSAAARVRELAGDPR